MAVLTLLSMVLAQTMQSLNDFQDKVAHCKKRTGATDADVQVIYQPVRARTYAAKCMRACLMQESNMMSLDGKLRYAGDGIFSKCIALSVPANHCEAAEAYTECIRKESKRHGKPKENHKMEPNIDRHIIDNW